MRKFTMKADTLYLADNGQIICQQCAGNCARTTGYDLSGEPIIAVDAEVMAEMVELFGEEWEPACESGCTRVAA
jgi:hypothetical protein